MRLCFSARGLAVPSGGVRQFIQSLIPALAATRQDDELVVVYNRPDAMGLAPDCEEVLLPGKNRLWWDHVTLPRALRRLRIDAAIFPKNIVPLRPGCRAFVVVHDLAYFVRTLHAYPFMDTAHMRLLLPGSMRRAEGVFAVSEHTRKDIVRYLSCDPQKIAVTPEAADSKYKPIDNAVELRQISNRYDLTETFVMYTGSLSPRKNMIRLLEAFSLIKDDIPHQLVLTGSKSWSDSHVFETIDRLGLRDRIHQVGYVDEADMPGLYNLAQAYVYPSLYEGFGLPVLEAMQCGCPVAASTATSVPEVAGDAAVLFDPLDTDAIAAALRQVLTDPDVRKRLKAAGRARAQEFSWDKCARAMWQAIRGNGNRQQNCSEEPIGRRH